VPLVDLHPSVRAALSSGLNGGRPATAEELRLPAIS
jgi:hypothetical protein